MDFEAGESEQLGDSGYIATKDENGYITITDDQGNVITSWDSTQENTQDNQTQDNQQKDDSVSDFEVDSDEYLLIENEDGSYTIAQGGVGLDVDEAQALIDKLKQEGKIPEDAIVNTDVLPPAPTDGKTEQSATIGDYVFKTSDGKNYQVYDKEGNLVTTISSDDYEKLEDDDLKENQDEFESGNSDNAGDKSTDNTPDPTPEPPEPSPTPEPPEPSPTPEPPEPYPTPEPPEPSPTPEPPEPSPTPEPTPIPETPEYTPTKPVLPNTGDASSMVAVATGLAGVALTGAGIAGMKKREKESKKNNNLTLIEGGKSKLSYDELLKKYTNEQQEGLNDYDDLEKAAMAWVQSKDRDEWLSRNAKSKGRTR